MQESDLISNMFSSKNIQFTGLFKDSLSTRVSRNLYLSFGNKDEVSEYLEFLSDGTFNDIVNNSEIEFRLNGNKYLKATFITIPYKESECETVMLIPTFCGNTPLFYNVEYMENEHYCLCEANSSGYHAILKLYDHIPTVDELWETIDDRCNQEKFDNVNIAIHYNGANQRYTYIMFEHESEEQIENILGSGNIKP